MKKINLHFVGVDGWDRAVFQSESGNYYKTIELMPDCGWYELSLEDKRDMLRTIHDSCPLDEFDGEPNNPIPFEWLELVE